MERGLIEEAKTELPHGAFIGLMSSLRFTTCSPDAMQSANVSRCLLDWGRLFAEPAVEVSLEDAQRLQKARAVHMPPDTKTYAWLRTAGYEGLVGIWNCPWATLEDQLPGRRLAGSGVGLKGFGSLTQATAFWHTKCQGPPTSRP